jgi:hypothetical protein
LAPPGGRENTLFVLSIPVSPVQTWWTRVPPSGYVLLRREHGIKAQTVCKSQYLKRYYTTLSSAVTVIKIP